MNDEMILSDWELSLVVSCTLGHKATRTPKDYQRELNAFKKFIGKDLMAATDQDGRNYLVKLRKDQKTPRTIKRIYDQLNAFYNFLFREGYTKENPFAKIEKPKASSQVTPERTPSPEDLVKLFAALKKTADPRDYAAILLILSTGLRVGKILSTVWTDFDEINGHRVYKVSSSPLRYAKVFDFVWDAIDSYATYAGMSDKHRKKPCLVFINTKDLEAHYIHTPEAVKKPITLNWIRKVMEKACYAAEIPLYTAKDLRHAFVLYALAMGIDKKDIIEQVGLCSENGIQKYVGSIEQILNPTGMYAEEFFSKIFKTADKK